MKECVYIMEVEKSFIFKLYLGPTQVNVTFTPNAWWPSALHCSCSDSPSPITFDFILIDWRFGIEGKI